MSGVQTEGTATEPMTADVMPDTGGAGAPRDASSAALSRRLAIPVILAAGWGALFAYTLIVLTDDGPVAAPAGPTRFVATEGIDVPEVRLPEPERKAAPAAGPARVLTVAAPAPPLETVVPPTEPRPAAPLVERAAFVGIWGPNAVACGQRQRRRGFLPATITEDGAKAGRTVCRFRNNRREGSAWTMAADCSERGRRWTSQVRLLVEHDRLTWTSGKGQANYIRCGRRSD
ncbi:hypothetical protein F8B43_4843 [Methylorubrum populi]|uniref:Peptidase inhibitor family I36 protein n=2 Tax=Methylorubrum populi TaxID=223967 RepID=A0A833J030_9HYPH|nr:hypothetical protein F8B43_4843 [Methylorubrum populi]